MLNWIVEIERMQVTHYIMMAVDVGRSNQQWTETRSWYEPAGCNFICAAVVWKERGLASQKKRDIFDRDHPATANNERDSASQRHGTSHMGYQTTSYTRTGWQMELNDSSNTCHNPLIRTILRNCRGAAMPGDNDQYYTLLF